MFGKKKVTKVRRTELPLICDGAPITVDYDPNAEIAQYVGWVAKEIDAGVQYRAQARHWEAEADRRSAENAKLKAHVDKAEAAIKQLNADIGQREAQIEGWRAKVGAAESAFAGVSRDAQSFLDRARKAEARAEAAEKRLAEQPLYARAAKAPEVVERKIWRVRAKAVELAALAEFKPGDGLREQAEFWRAARKLGVPVDEVKYYALHQDVMEFYSWAGEPAGCSFNTMVYEIG